MFEILLSLTALVLVVSMITAYRETQDILHPAMFLGPLFLYGAVFDPWVVRHHLGTFFSEPQQVNRVLLLHLLAVTALSVGLVHKVRGRRHFARGTRAPLLGHERGRLRSIAFVLSSVALVCYGYGIAMAGGFVAAFSQPKGGGHSGSGYINEAMHLGLVAAMLLALSQYRRGFTTDSFLLLLVGLLPNLVQGTFGGRRGPLFLATVTASLAWFLVRARKPRLWMVAGCLAVACLAVTFVWSQRQHLYLGSENAVVRWGDFVGTLTQDEVAEGNNFIYGAAYVLAIEESGKFTWGKALAVDLLIRPIPKQLWPTKYEDTGAVWVTSKYPGLGPLSTDDWLTAVGWLPLAGSAGISISDVFGEFWWGAVPVFYFLGRGFGWLYFMARTRGGVWTLLSFEAVIPSIYLATQSFSAFYYRFLILAVPTVLAWKLVITARNLRRAPHSPDRVLIPSHTPSRRSL